jgi:hypothetical protein
VQLRFSHSCGSLLWLVCLVALISFLRPKLVPSPIDLHSSIWFPRLAGPSSFRLLRDFGICSVSLHCSVRSSFGSAWSLPDCRLAQPSLCPIVPGLCPIVILVSLFLRVVCRRPDSFCDLLFGSSFIVDLSRGLPSTIPGFRCGS